MTGITQAVAEITRGDLNFKLNSLPALALVLLVLLFVGSQYLLSQRMENLEKGQKRILEEMQVITYVLSVPPEKRPTLVAPPALRNRVQP